MVKSKNGQRSNFSLLPFEIQYRMIGLLQDGATFAVLASDPEIARAYRDRGMKLVPPAVTRIKQSAQYKDWTERRMRERIAVTADRLTTEFLRENASLDTVAEQTKVALLKAMSDLSDLSDMTDDAEKIKAVRQLSASVATLANDDLRRKLEEAKRLHGEAEAEWKTREAELLTDIASKEARIRELEAAVPGVDSAGVADAMRKRLGLKTEGS